MDVSVPSVNYYSTAIIPVTLKVPEDIEAGQARVVMELRHDQAQSVPNDMDVFVAPKDFVATHSGGRVALYDPEGTTRRALESIGLNVHKVTKMRSEEHTSELQSLMRNSYAVFCLKKKKDRSTNDIRTREIR